MSTPGEPTSGDRDQRRKSRIRFVVFLLLAVGGFLLLRVTPLRDHLQPRDFLELLERLRELPAAPLLFVAIGATLMALGLPASAVVFANGAIFGYLLGALLSYLSMLGAASASYLLAKTLARDFVVQTLGPRLELVERLLERQGFWALVGLRFFPMPFAITNNAASLVGVPFDRFIGSSAVGLAPTSLIMSYFSATIVTAAGSERGAAMFNLAIAFVLLMLLSFLPSAIRAWKNRRERSDPR